MSLRLAAQPRWIISKPKHGSFRKSLGVQEKGKKSWKKPRGRAWCPCPKVVATQICLLIFTLNLGVSWSNWTSMFFQMGWNHQPLSFVGSLLFFKSSSKKVAFDNACRAALLNPEMKCQSWSPYLGFFPHWCNFSSNNAMSHVALYTLCLDGPDLTESLSCVGFGSGEGWCGEGRRKLETLGFKQSNSFFFFFWVIRVMGWYLYVLGGICKFLMF